MFSGESNLNYKYKRRSLTKNESKKLENCNVSKVLNSSKKIASIMRAGLVSFPDQRFLHNQNIHQYSFHKSFFNINNSIFELHILGLYHFILPILVLLIRKYGLWTDKCKCYHHIVSTVRTTVFVFLIFDVCIVRTNGNACWLQQQSNGKCTQMYQQEISIEDCCSVECRPCNANCNQMKCGSQKKCAIKNGRPKCVCSILCKTSKAQKKLKLATFVTNSREIRSLSSEIYINTFNQRRLTKTTLNLNSGNNNSSRGISSKIKRTVSSSTLITAHIFDTTMKPNIRGMLNRSNKKHKHHDYDQIIHQIQKHKNKYREKEREIRIRNDLAVDKYNKFNSTHNNNNSSRYKDINGIPSFSSFRKLKQYQQYENNKNSGESATLHFQSHKNRDGFNIQKQQQQQKHQSQQKQQPPENLQIDNKFLEHKPASYHKHNLWKLDSKDTQQQQNSNQMKLPHNPVCGNDGKTYKTECLLRKRACRKNIPTLAVAYRGHCRTSCQYVGCINNLTCVEDQFGLPNCISCNASEVCLSDSSTVDSNQTVCGIDGQTYRSTCELKRLACRLSRSIAIAYKGPCQEEESCNTINCGPKMKCLVDRSTHRPRCVSCRYKCDRIRSMKQNELEPGPICGTNNRTYNSWCHMRRESCQTEVLIEIKHIGRCKSEQYFNIN